MPYVCGKCDGQVINVYKPLNGPEERQCACGNITIQGITPRWPIVYQESHKNGCETGRHGTVHSGEPKTMPGSTDTELVPAGDPSRAVTSPRSERADVRTGIGLSADRHTDAAEAPASVPKPKGVKMSHRICKFEGCQRQVVKGGLCFRHYQEKYGVMPKVRNRVEGAVQPMRTPPRAQETIEISAQFDYDRLSEAIVSKINGDTLAHAIVEKIYSRLTTKHIIFKFNGAEEKLCQG